MHLSASVSFTWTNLNLVSSDLIFFFSFLEIKISLQFFGVIWCHRYLASHPCVYTRMCTRVVHMLWLQWGGGVRTIVTCVRGGDASTTGPSLGRGSWLSASSPSSLAQTQTSWQSFSADTLTSSPHLPPLSPSSFDYPNRSSSQFQATGGWCLLSASLLIGQCKHCLQPPPNR